MSRILVIGVTGYAGSAITSELVSRGHEVVGVARDTSSSTLPIEKHDGSIHDADFIRTSATGVDQIVVALPARALQEGGPKLVDALPSLVEIAVSEGARLSFVGGAGSLAVAEGGPALVDTPDFPADYRGEALDHAAVLDALRATDDSLDWFYVSPAATFGSWNAGERTGSFRIGGDVLLTDPDGNSDISGADFAIAYVDEIEQGKHHRQRFSVAY